MATRPCCCHRRRRAASGQHCTIYDCNYVWFAQADFKRPAGTISRGRWRPSPAGARLQTARRISRFKVCIIAVRALRPVRELPCICAHNAPAARPDASPEGNNLQQHGRHTRRRRTRRIAGAAADALRTGAQSQNRHGARPQDFANVAGAGRPGDRMKQLSVQRSRTIQRRPAILAGNRSQSFVRKHPA